MAERRSRREFLESLGIGTAGMVVGGYAATARGYAKNETIGIGVIGTGGRARIRLMPALKQIPGTQIVAVCDVYDDHLEAGQFLAGGKTSDVFTTRYSEQLLARNDVDAVIIATPDHWHVPLTIDACAAGKDVYVEKPLTHNIEEGQSVIDAKNKHRRVVQVGTQQRSMTHIIEAKKIVESGVLGAVRKVFMSWNRNSLPMRKLPYNIKPESVDWKRFLGNAPPQPFDAYKMRQWRWFWDFGAGILTDLMVHWHDVANWYLDPGLPKQAVTIGDLYATEGMRETPDTIQTLLDYPHKGMQMHFEGTFVNSHNRACIKFMCEDATLYIDRGRYELHPEPQRDVQYRSLILGQGPRGADFFDKPEGEVLHLSNWLEAIRTRSEPSAPVEAGVLAATVAHMGNKAYRERRVVSS